MRLRSLVFVVPSALALGVLAPAGVAAAADPAPEGSYTTVDVPGADCTEVTGINNWGAIVGTYGDDEGQHGFIKFDGHITTVDAPHTGSTVLTSINDAGTVTGYYLTDYGGRTHGFLRDASGHFTQLDAIPAKGPTPSGTVATQVNDAGLVVGYYFTTESSDPNWGAVTHGFIWQNRRFTTYDVAPTDASGPPRPGTTQLAGLNNAGVLVGTASYPTSGVPPAQSFVDSGGSVRTFVDPALNPAAGYCNWTSVSGINDWGILVGNSGNGCSNENHPAPTASAWTVDHGTFTYLAYPSAARTQARGINEWGTVVGTWTDASGQDHGFVLRSH